MEQTTWIEQFGALGGKNPLTSFEPSSFGQVDLARAHPGGLAQLVSSHSATMTNLVRDGVAQARSLSAARRIRQKSKRISESFGVESSFIAGGLVRDYSTNQQMPILLWHTVLIPKGEDFELRIATEPSLNPALTSLIRSHRPDFRESDLIAIAAAGPDLIPTAVLSLVAQFLNSDQIEIEKLLVLGNFVPDLLLSTPSEKTSGFFAERSSVAAEAPALTLVANADSMQQSVIRRAMLGESFAVQTLPGAGYIQTVLNLLANLALSGKRTLLAAPRQQTMDELVERAAAIGLAGLVIRESDVWADAVSAISRNEKAQGVNLEPAQVRLSKAEAGVKEYFDSVQSVDNPLGISLTQALTTLADLAALHDAPTNQARIRTDLAPIRESGEALIAEAFEAGVFKFGPQDTPWYGARFQNSAEIAEVLRSVKELSGEEFRTLSYQINRYLAELKLASVDSVHGWATQLTLLLGIRETLDKFLPSIYDRPLTEMIAATAPRGQRGELSGAQRRRFRKLAKQLVRPGSSVPNLHLALIAAEQQRVMWFELNSTQAPPSVPLGLSDVQQKYDRIHQVLDRLQRHMDPNPDLELLTQLSFEKLGVTLERLALQTEILDRILERQDIVNRLEALGLGELHREIAKVSPSKERAISEFQLCWWQSALELIVASNPKSLEFTAEKVADLESEYESAAEALVRLGAQKVSEQLAQQWKSAIAKHPAQADELRVQLRSRKLSIASGSKAGAVWKALTPAVICSPLRSHALATEQFDVVVVLDAAFTGVAEALPIMQKAGQVIGFGDPVISAPENFDTVARANQGYVESDRQSVFSLLMEEATPSKIAKSYRLEGQVLGTYLNQNFYENQLVLEPSSSHFFGAQNFEHIEITEGALATSTIEGATESLDSEVQKVTEIVLNHARWTPELSLMVVSASRSHSERIQAAVADAVAGQPQLAEFFDAHGRERFEVLTMSETTHRIADRVIFSVGFGRTPEGRISGTLGDFNSPHAARWMVNQIASARKKLTVVSCYGFEDLASGKLPENQLWLKDLIAPSFLSEARSGDPDPLLKDLSLRLQKLGLKVELNFAGRIALAVSFGQKAAVVDPDWSLQGDGWDEKLRLRPGLLRAMGWDYLRVHALEIFAQPQDVANRIAARLGVRLEEKKEPLFDEKAFEDTDRAWGDGDDSNDDRLRDDKPPHWG